MKTKLPVLVCLTIGLWLSAASAQAQAGPRFWLGGSFQVLLMDGTGEIGAEGETIVFDFTEEFPGGIDDNQIGLGWDNKLLMGARPMAGIKINEHFGIYGAYTLFLTKDSQVQFYDEFLQDGSMNIDYEWKETSLDIMAQFYPSPGSGFHVLAGYQMIDFEITETDTYIGDIGSETDSFKNDDSTSGLVIGLGFDSSTDQSMSFFFSAAYSFAKYDDTQLFDDEVELFEVELGGVAAEAGIKFFLGGN